MTSNPYAPPKKNSDAKPKWAVSSVVASVSGVVIWLAVIAGFWIAYEPTFVNGDIHIEYDFQSSKNPYVFGYVESETSGWLAFAVAIVALIAIIVGCHYIARLYQRRQASRQTLRDADSTPLL